MPSSFNVIDGFTDYFYKKEIRYFYQANKANALLQIIINEHTFVFLIAFGNVRGITDDTDLIVLPHLPGGYVKLKTK